MGREYSDPKRADLPHALPDVEVFYIDNDDHVDVGEDGEPLESGWYWWSCFPGCLPDSEPFGPYETEQEAIEDAQADAEEEG